MYGILGRLAVVGRTYYYKGSEELAEAVHEVLKQGSVHNLYMFHGNQLWFHE